MNKSTYFAEGDFFHVFNKSIAGFQIFKDRKNSKRFLDSLKYYNNTISGINFARYLRSNKEFSFSGLLNEETDGYVKFFAYCVMPDHFHLLVKIQKEQKLSQYMSVVENSFSRYFNIRFDRKGPLWQSRFKAVKIDTDEELLHVGRYIHLNPVTSYLVEKPEDWEWSSYNLYIRNEASFGDFSFSNPDKYKQFVEDNIDYQRTLGNIKRHLKA